MKINKEIYKTESCITFFLLINPNFVIRKCQKFAIIIETITNDHEILSASMSSTIIVIFSDYQGETKTSPP